MAKYGWRGSFFGLGALLVGPVWVPSMDVAFAAQGFGGATPGGSDKKAVHVTNLNDSGSGSLRAALLYGNRRIVFDLAGTINLSSALNVRGSYVTIDGSSAPSPGIAIRQAGLRIASSRGSCVRGS